MKYKTIEITRGSFQPKLFGLLKYKDGYIDKFLLMSPSCNKFKEIDYKKLSNDTKEYIADHLN